MAAIYRDLVAHEDRIRQVSADVAAALDRGRNCLVLTQWVAHVGKLAEPCARSATTRSCCAVA